MSAALAQRRRDYARAMVGQLEVPDPVLEDAFAAVPREAFMPPGRWVILRPPAGREVLAANDPMALYPLAASPEVLVELDAACKRAEEVILDQRVFVLEGADFDAFA